MRINVVRNGGLPKLAWMAKVEPQANTLSATLGEWVEILDNGLIEGVADNEFLANPVDRTNCVFGSDAVTFVSSTATTDYLYWLAADDGRVVHVSNSLPLLLAGLNDRLDPHCLDYSEINHSIVFGVQRYRKRIPTSKGAVNRLIHRNLQVSAAGVTEMDPWRLGTTYDRPIPRRIAEYAGLAREMFGQVKMATVLEYPAPRLPLNPALRSLFFSFLVDNGLLARWQIPLFPLILKWNTIIGTTSPKVHTWNYYLQRAVSRLIGRPFTFPLLWQRLNGSIFCFCVNRRVDELRQRLNLQWRAAQSPQRNDVS